MMETSLCELRVQQAPENWVESVQIPGEAQPGAGISHETKPRPQGVGTACGQGTQGIVLLLKCSPGLWSTTPENLWPYPTLCRSLERALLLLRAGAGGCSHHRRGGLAVRGVCSWSGAALGTGESPSSALFSASRFISVCKQVFPGPFPP